MPVYEYKCPSCKKVFEILWRSEGLQEDMLEPHPCPYCGTLSPKIFSPFNFQFSPYLKELGEGRMVNY